MITEETSVNVSLYHPAIQRWYVDMMARPAIAKVCGLVIFRYACIHPSILSA